MILNVTSCEKTQNRNKQAKTPTNTQQNIILMFGTTGAQWVIQKRALWVESLLLPVIFHLVPQMGHETKYKNIHTHTYAHTDMCTQIV